jgi:hypothetical protein
VEGISEMPRRKHDDEYNESKSVLLREVITTLTRAKAAASELWYYLDQARDATRNFEAEILERERFRVATNVAVAETQARRAANKTRPRTVTRKER